MTRTIPLDYLFITSSPGVTLAALEETLASLRLGVLDVMPPSEDPAALLVAGRERAALGRIGVRETLGRIEATCAIERHARPVMVGLAAEAQERLGAGLDAVRQHTFRAGNISIDLHVSLLDPDLRWGLLWVVACLERVADRFDAVVFDPAAQRCQTPEMVARLREQFPIGHVALHNEPWGPEARWLHTHGLQKFGQPELELVGVPQAVETVGISVLRVIAETLANSDPSLGPSLRAGMQVECEGAGTLIARNAPADRDHQAPFGRLRLVTQPLPGQEPGMDAQAIIIAAGLQMAQEALDLRDYLGAQRTVDRVLVAAPDLPAALALKARLLLAQGQPGDALELADFIALHAPADPQGPYISGLALMALGRLAEAQGALSRAVTLDPDDPAPFEARARLYERVGHTREAAEDRARARMLRG
jgi:hypothetical protein